MTIGIIGAMDDEVNLYLQELKNKQPANHAEFQFFSGQLNNKEVIIVKSGAGKVNAAACTQILIDKFKISQAIFTGVAGALNPELEIGDIVISKDSIQHDVDSTALGFEKGQILFSNLKIFKAEEKLADLAYKISTKLGLKTIKGRILTGDQFITDKEKSKSLFKEFQGECVDMESAALAHVCTLNKIPHLIIRSISDKADHSATIDFKEFCKKAAKNSFTIVKELVKNIVQEEKTQDLEYIKSKIRTIPNFPKQGIMFRDITTLFKDKEGLQKVIEVFYNRYKYKKIDVVAGIESRGFIIGGALAEKLGCGFVPIRKKGKLPAETISQTYDLEYGTDTVEIHKDSIKPESKVLLIDDLIATGGTALASTQLIEKLGGKIIEIGFIIDLPDLKGKEKITKWPVFTMVEFKGE